MTHLHELSVLVCLSGGGGRAEEEADDHRLPAEEVRAEQENSGDLQQETARLCSGTAQLVFLWMSCEQAGSGRLQSPSPLCIPEYRIGHS